MRRNIVILFVAFVLPYLVVPVTLGQQRFSQSEISIKPLNWNGKEHSIEALKKGIQNTLNGLKIKRADKTSDITVELSFEVVRAWLIHGDGQYLSIKLPSTLVLQVSNTKSLTIPIESEMRLQFSNEGGMAQKMTFETYQVAQDVCKNIKGGFPEDKLWESVSEDHSGKVSQILKASVTWLRTNSLREVESLLSNKSAYLRKSVVYLLGEIKTENAVTLLKNISVEDKSEAVRDAAKEILGKVGKSE